MAKIIKGSGEGGPRAAPAVLGASGEKKVINKRVFSAHTRGDELVVLAQERAHLRARQAEERAQEVFDAFRAHEARLAKQAAVERILRAYKKRGDTLSAARQEVITVASTLVAKVVGAPPTINPNNIMAIVETGLKARRGKYCAVVQIPVDDVAVMSAHQPLREALARSPEIRLETGDRALLKVSGVEIELDTAMAASALCTVFGITRVPGIDQPAAPSEENRLPPAPGLDEDMVAAEEEVVVADEDVAQEDVAVADEESAEHGDLQGQAVAEEGTPPVPDEPTGPPLDDLPAVEELDPAHLEPVDPQTGGAEFTVVGERPTSPAAIVGRSGAAPLPVSSSRFVGAPPPPMLRPDDPGTPQTGRRAIISDGARTEPSIPRAVLEDDPPAARPAPRAPASSLIRKPAR